MIEVAVLRLGRPMSGEALPRRRVTQKKFRVEIARAISTRFTL